MSKYILRPKEERPVTFLIRVKKEDLIKFEELCRKTGRSRNELVNMAMRYFIENVEIQNESQT